MRWLIAAMGLMAGCGGGQTAPAPATAPATATETTPAPATGTETAPAPATETETETAPAPATETETEAESEEDEGPDAGEFLRAYREKLRAWLDEAERARLAEVTVDIPPGTALEPALRTLQDTLARELLTKAIEASRCPPLQKYARFVREMSPGRGHESMRLREIAPAGGAITEGFCRCYDVDGRQASETCRRRRAARCERCTAASQACMHVAQGLEPATVEWRRFSMYDHPPPAVYEPPDDIPLTELFDDAIDAGMPRGEVVAAAIEALARAAEAAATEDTTASE